MKTKEKVLEALEGKRTEIIWELILKAIKEIYVKGDFPTETDIEETKERYLEYEDIINDKSYRYIIVEQYNFGDDFYCRFYEDNINLKGHIPFSQMFEDYFSDVDGWEKILCVDMWEMKCYLIDKEIKYPIQEVKIK